MRNININVYKLDELSDEVQNNVISHYRNFLSDDFCDELDVSMNEEFATYINTLDFTLSYSLSYCQGDGVSFAGKVDNKEELLKLANLVYSGNIPRKVLRLINWGIIYMVNFDRFNSHYTHKYTVTPIVVDNYNIDDTFRITNTINEFEMAIKCWYYTICDNLEKFGYDKMTYLSSDDNIRDYIIENDLEFFADGSNYDE